MDNRNIYPMLLGALFISHIIAVMTTSCCPESAAAQYDGMVDTALTNEIQDASPARDLFQQKAEVFGIQSQESYGSYYTMEHGFNFDYPADWKKTEISSDEICFSGEKVVFPDITKKPDIFELKVTYLERPHSIPFEEWYEKVAKEYDLDTENQFWKVRYCRIYHAGALKFKLVFRPAMTYDNSNKEYQKKSQEYEAEIEKHYHVVVSSVELDV